MALKKKMSDAENKRWEEIGLKFCNCLEFKLTQDNAAYRPAILEAFAKWLMVKPRRIQRYESLDMRLVDEFIDFFWPWIMDEKKPWPEDPPEPTKAAPRVERAEQPWWRDPNAVRQQAQALGHEMNLRFDERINNWVVVNR